MMTSGNRNIPALRFFRRVGLVIWQHLMLLLVLDLLLCLAALPAALLFVTGFTLLAPLWAGTCALANCMVRDESVTPGTVLHMLRLHWWRGLTISLVPAGVLTALIGTFSLIQVYPGETWLYLPLIIDGCVTVLLLFAGMSVYALATLRTATVLRGWSLWRSALALAAVRPHLTIGSLFLFAFVGLLVAWFNIGLLPMLAAPLALYLAVFTHERLESVQGWREEGKRTQ